METQEKNRIATDLSRYDNSWFDTGAGGLKRLLWYMTNALFFINPLNPSIGIKVALLKIFGAKVGKGVIIKPGVNIKYPWKLVIGDHAWIGERVWIDNLAEVRIGKHCCLSQGAMLLTGNHNYRKSTFDLMVKEIELQEGAWVGAFSIVCPGVTMKSHSVLSVNSVAAESLDAYTIYRGNPATPVRERDIRE